ncbi:MAG: nitrite reductase (NAD(P)H) small subunit [Ktedonobacteraceae bacterium]|nr:nitrite reductase (NAD(P)H) small subunit [Ktedonobacteraceae bacterium]MBO0790364.1 nitrite reductase (NAD(P)H) small subunit [Ktedonobacteraceae bacterium]
MATTLPASKVIYNLGPLSRIPAGEGRTFQVEDTPIAVFHTRSGNIFATQAFCPHKGGPLSDGIVGSHKVICPLHAYKFDLETGEQVGNACEKLKTYPITLNEAGNLLLTLI